MKSVAAADQLELMPEPRCTYCGPLGWTKARHGRILHKCGCPHRTDDFCQAHPAGCDTFTDVRTRAYRATYHSRVQQLTELPGTTWEDLFACQIDESAGLKDEAA